MNRKMTKFEESHVNRLCANGCWICARYSEWHHWLHGLNGVKISRCHLFGIPLCPEHHRTAKDSVHMMGSEAEFCKLHGLDKQRSIDEVATSLEKRVSGLRLV